MALFSSAFAYRIMISHCLVIPLNDTGINFIKKHPTLKNIARSSLLLVETDLATANISGFCPAKYFPGSAHRLVKLLSEYTI